MQKRSELFFSLLLLPIDFVAIIAAFVAAYAIRVKIDARPVANPLKFALFLKIFLLLAPVWILIFALSGLYNLSSLRGRIKELGRILVAVSGGFMFIILVDFLERTPIFPSKSIPIYGFGLSLIFVAAGRQIVRSIQRYLFKFGIGIHRAVVVGSGPIAQRLVGDLRNTRRSGYKLVGAVDSAPYAGERLRGLAIYHDFGELIGRVGEHGIDEIIQADSGLEPDEILEMVSFAANHHKTYRFVPNQFGIYATNSAISTMAGLPIIEIQQTALEGWGRILKRTFDLVGSIIGLIVLSPMFALVALIIKLSDRGPIFYKHKRISRTGKPIYLYKFRTMYQRFCTGEQYQGRTDEEVLAGLGPELAAQFRSGQKLNHDPRVTPFGRWLRLTSIDELPQLFNVLAGSLSLVGPRPIIEQELVRYGQSKSAFLALKPGLTGLWQTSGRSDLSYEERVKLDIYYVENWSLLLDLRILVRTISVVWRHQGAY